MNESVNDNLRALGSALQGNLLCHRMLATKRRARSGTR